MLAVPQLTQRRRSRLSHTTSGDSSEGTAEALGHLPSDSLPDTPQFDPTHLVPQLSGIPALHHGAAPTLTLQPHAAPTLSGPLPNCDSSDLDLSELRSSLPRIKSLKPSFDLQPHLDDAPLTPSSRRGMRASSHFSGAFDPSTPQFASEQRWPESASSPLSCGTPGGNLLGMSSMFNVDEFCQHASAASNFGSSCNTPCPLELLAGAGLGPDLSMSPVTHQTYADFALEQPRTGMQLYSNNELYRQRSTGSDASMSTASNSPVLKAPGSARLMQSPAGSPLAVGRSPQAKQRKEQQSCGQKPRLVVG